MAYSNKVHNWLLRLSQGHPKPSIATNSSSDDPPSSATDTDAESFWSSDHTSDTSTISEQTKAGVSVKEPSRNTSHRSPRQQNANVHLVIDPIARKYEIRKTMAIRLEKLRDFEIVIVIDDSGSMTTTVDGTQGTRWDELRAIVKVVIEIGMIFDSNGVDIYFINGRIFHKVKDPRIVDEAFATPPSGYTPLVPVLEEIFESKLARPGRDKKLLVFVATDGEPTDDNGDSVVPELERLMREKRQVTTTYVSFLLCTDDLNCVAYLSRWDKDMVNVDVTDDFYTETAKIRQHRGPNFPFTFGDYIVKALIGAIDREIDILNEPA